MLPFYFGRSDHRLFGTYDAPAEHSSPRGVLICNAAGSEYYNAHRACRTLARKLAGSGVHAMRFDYFGTGDSAGEEGDVRPDDWLGDVGTAVAELLDLAGLRKIDLVGLRVGAALAAAVAGGIPEIERICLWDPILDPSDIVGDTGLLGFSSEFLSGLGNTLRMEEMRLPAGSILVCTGNDPARHEPLARRLKENSPELGFTFHREHGAWESGGVEFGSLPAPVQSLQTISEWSLDRGGA